MPTDRISIILLRELLLLSAALIQMDYASPADTIHLVQVLNTQQKNISVFIVNYEDNY